MMDSKRRETLLIIAAVACVALFAGDRLVLTPLGRVWKTRSARIADLKTSVEKGEILLDRLDDLEKRWDEARTASQYADFSQAEERLLMRMQTWSAQSGLNPGTLRPRWRDTDGDSPKFEMRLSASGPLGAIARFLYEAEADPLPVSIEELGMTARDNRGSVIDINLRFSSLVLKEVSK